MAEMNFYTIFIIQIFCQVLSRINTAMLSACTTEREHKIVESSLHPALHMMVGKSIDTIKEGEYLAILLKEINYRLIQSCLLFIFLITTWVVGGSTVEDITAAISRLVFRDAFLI